MAQGDPTVLADSNSAFLTPDVSGPLFERASQLSVVQRLARQVPLGINGMTVPVVTGEAQASWVAEGGNKPATETAIGVKSMQPKKVAAISVVSKEVVRANPGNYMTVLRDQLATAIAKAFDSAVLHGTNTPFSQYLDQTTKSVELGGSTQANGGVYMDFVEAMRLIVTDKSAVSGGPSSFDRRVTGFALDSVAEINLLGAVDTTGRALFVDVPPATD